MTVGFGTGLLLLCIFCMFDLNIAKPHTKGSHTRTHVRAHTLREYDGDAQCVRASRLLGFLLHRPDVFRTSFHLHSLTLNEFAEGFTGLNIFDGDMRQEILCRLDDLETVDVLIVYLQTMGIDEQFVKLAYGYVASFLPVFKSFTLSAIKNNWVDDEHHANLQLEFTNHLEASGFLKPQGFAASEAKLFMDAYLWEPETLESVDKTEVPLSSQPLDVQCSRLVLDLSNLFDYEVALRQEDFPGVRSNLTAIFQEWTGLTLTTENAHQIVCGLLDAVHDGGLPTLYSFIDQLGVFPTIVRQGYPILAQTIRQSAKELDEMLGVVEEMEAEETLESEYINNVILNDYIYPDNPDYEFGYYPDDFFEVLAFLGKFYHTLDDMGLLDLP